MKARTIQTPETTIGALEGQGVSFPGLALAATCYGLAVLWAWASDLKRWLLWRRVCSWHQPKPIRLSGNPLCWRTTNGVCIECHKRIAEMYKL
jgi:hypothetical protein